MGPGKERAPWNQLIESVVTACSFLSDEVSEDASASFLIGVWKTTTFVVIEGWRGVRGAGTEKLYVCRELEMQREIIGGVVGYA